MRKIISIFLAVVFLCGIGMPVQAQETKEVMITDADEFLAFAESCRLDSYSKELTVSLEADIDLEGIDFSGIPIFCGTFLGNGHTISGLNITGKGSEQGLFRYLTQAAVVKDLNVTGIVAPQGSRSTVGGIVGSNAGVIQNCSFSGEMSGDDRIGGIAGNNTVSGIIENCRTKGTFYGNHFVGGIAGENTGVIRSCENIAGINTTSKQNSVEISDITMDTITGTESANTVTDIGGIAGTSSGTIRGSINRGDVGYQHMGYNVGGIAGSQTGYLVDCENYGAISGRKEVGGIVGHMEPSILLNYETDAIRILRSQMEILDDLIDRAVLNSQNNTAAIRALVTALENHVANAEAALAILTIDPKNPEIHDPDTYIAAVQTIGNSITGIDNTVRSLYQAVKNTGDDLETDLKAISDQVEVINKVLDNSEDNLGGDVTDISDADTENDLDPEEDVKISGEISLNVIGELRSVVIHCFNSGSITAKKQNSGGIVGWQSLGLVRDCTNDGVLEGGDYTGGIAGQSQGYIRASYVKSAIAGDVYVGGIAGSGVVVTDCRSMVKVSGSERVGTILGFAEENETDEEQPVLGNLYACVDGDPGAIDGISYDGLAQAVEWKEFLVLENLPEIFQTVTVTFKQDDSIVKQLQLSYGDALKEEEIPKVPDKEGFTGRWEGLEEADLENILFDMTFEAVYTSHGMTIASAESRSGKPVLLVQGDFSPDSVITMEKSVDAPALTNGETLLECWQFAVSEYVHTTAARLLLPEGAEEEHLSLYVKSGGGNWKEAEYTVDGSYIAFAMECGDDRIALAQTESVELPWAWMAGAAVAIIAVMIIVMTVRRRKNRNGAPNDEEITESADQNS